MAFSFPNVLCSMPKCLTIKEDCHYTPQFCEENIWMLTKKMQETSPELLKFCFPIFISNENRLVPIYRQSVSRYEDGFIVWDYHVILVFSTSEDTWVFDFDTQLPFPSKFDRYCEETFKPGEYLNPKYDRYFRVISAENYLKYFSSDRRHMRSEDGTWRKPPPNYPAINNSHEVHNLDQYISIKGDEVNGKFGQVLNLNMFIERFTKKLTCTDKHVQHVELDYSYPPEPKQPSWLE